MTDRYLAYVEQQNRLDALREQATSDMYARVIDIPTFERRCEAIRSTRKGGWLRDRMVGTASTINHIDNLRWRILTGTAI